MAQIPETLSMDRNRITFAKRKQLTISKNLAILLLVTVIICLAVVGVLTYFLTSNAGDELCRERLLKQKHEIEDCIESSPSSVSSHVISDTETTTTSDTTEEGRTVPEKSHLSLRLPTSVIPMDYELRILTRMTNFTFSGGVRIRVNVVEPTKNITMHTNDLQISNPSVTQDRSSEERFEFDISEWKILKRQQFLVLYFDDMLEVGEYNVTVRFEGKLNDELAGYYRSSYTVDNKTHWLALTQFEATDARRAFPCFDEPAMKATFKITIGRPKKLMAISNMPKTGSHAHPLYKDYVWDDFQRTVPMSTYLVAFIVSDFKSNRSGNFSLYARESALSQTQFAVDIGPKFLAFYESYFNISFPLPKMDLAAIPDFSAGAMENWGLITFREASLLYQEGVSTKRNLQYIATVIAHELAHQWFGNLVTPSWWTDLWLNEGFASYLENFATAAVFPEWKLMDQFVVDDLQNVFKLDALKSSHPISIPVNDPNEINDIFDQISYDKGATIIRMMESFLTTDCFRKGLTNYLNAKKYKNAEQDDLWMALSKQAHDDGVLRSDVSVKDVMDTWTLQIGFPIVSVHRSDNGLVTVAQKKFALNSNDSAGDKFKWWIPLSFKDASNNNGNMWLGKETKEMKIPKFKVDANDWVLLNLNQTAYYRVNYDVKGWQLIESQLREDHTVFDPKNRAQIMDDALSLASSGYLNYKVALNLTTYLPSEEEYVPIKAALNNLNYIIDMFERSGHYDVFRDYLLSLIMPLFKKVGFQDNASDPLLLTFTRSTIVERACALDLPECVDRAVTDFHNWMLAPDPDRNNVISPNLKSTVYCTAIKIGGEAVWKFAWQRFLHANVGTERELLMRALGCTREPWLLNKYLALAFDPTSGIKKQDVVAVFRAVGDNIIGQTVGFKYLISNWDAINAYMGKAVMTNNILVKAVTKNMNTAKELADIKSFNQQHAHSEAFSKRVTSQIIEKTEANIEWMQKYYSTILDWLIENKRQ